MKRSNKGRRIGVFAWLFAAALPIGGLILVFTYGSAPRAGNGGVLGIAQGEASWYSSWFDLTRADSTAAKPERYLFSSPAGDCMMDDRSPGWSTQWFEAHGHGDSVEVRRLRTVDGGFVVKFRREEPFRAQRHIVLMPATVETMRAKYLELLAHELGLVTPEVSFVRVIACGLDQGIYLKEERIDADFLEKQGLSGASPFTQGHDPTRPDHLFPDFGSDTIAGEMVRRTLELAYADLQRGRAEGLPYIVDAEPAVGLLLMEWIEHDDAAFSSEHAFAYSWSRGRIVPIYRRARSCVPRMEAAPVGMNFLTAMLRNDKVREELKDRRQELLEGRWRLKERFAAMDRAWLPILAEGGSLSHAQAIAQGIQDELIGDRLDKEDPLAVLDRPLVRWAGYASFRDSVRSERYWPTADDAAILQRLAERTKAQVNGDTLFFPRGRYAVTSDLTVPYGIAVVIEAGARFEIDAGRSVIVQGPLFIRGTQRNPVFVRALDDAKPFGTFALLGDGTTRCSINGLQLSGGSEARVNGVYFSGQFAIHGAGTTIMSASIIGTSHGEDLLNIKGGLVDLRDCVFEDGSADLVDLDACKGQVVRCTFRSGREDANGDGLDVSGARVLVTGCTFTHMMDKGISVGEASQLLVRASRFEGNRMALAAKDLSIAYVEGNSFLENRVVFGAYRKKPIYGGARVMRYANEYVGNTSDQEVDELSAVVPQERLDEKVLKMFAAGQP